uniref:Uncharacterized protein n=1 Tax=Rhizophora mucronata TaxID=61149 RepID=A0A2P2NXQ2_RHIMU
MVTTETFDVFVLFILF